MKKRIFVIFMLTISLLGYSQTLIKGRIIGREGESISGASITISKDSIVVSSLADNLGAFSFEAIEGGMYDFTVASIDRDNYVDKILVTENATLDLGDILLMDRTEKVIQLQTVEIIGRSKKDYNSDYSFSSSKIAMKNMETTQAISTVTKELFADRQAFRLGDVVKNISGVNAVSYHNHFSIRGVTQSSDFKENRTINGMRAVVGYYNQPLNANIERVEVIKGPASLMFSNTDPGGTINLVTKKPLSNKRNEISFGMGSYDSYRAAADFTGPLTEDKTLLYRLNVGYENSQSFRDLQFKKAYLISPSVSYIPNDRTKLNLELMISDDKSRMDRGQHIFGDFNLNGTPIASSASGIKDYNHDQQMSIAGSLNHKLTEKLVFNLNYMGYYYHEDLLEHRSGNTFAQDINGDIIPNLVAMRVVQRDQKWFTNNLNAYFNADINWGELKNKVVFGYDVIGFKLAQGSGESVARGYLTADQKATINSYNPANSANYAMQTINGIVMPKPNVPHFDLSNPNHYINDLSDYIWKKSEYPRQDYTVHGAYLQNQMSYKNIIFNFGLRQEWYVDITNTKLANEVKIVQKKLLKRFGLMYKIINKINVYGAYVEGYQPSTPASLGNPNAGIDFDPMASDMYEFGAKTEWLNGKLKANIAWFNIHQKNNLVNANDLNNPDRMIARSKRSKGFEIDVTGKITSNFQTNFSYSYIDAKILEDENQALVGLREENTAKNSFSFWGRYDFTRGSLKNLGIGLGSNYVGERMPWFTRDYTLPAYTLVDGAIFYKLDKVHLSININNIFNEKYWVGGLFTRLYPGAPRNLMVNVRYIF